MRDHQFRLEDILEFIDRIETYTAQGRRSYDDNRLVEVWVIYHLILIGEAAARLPFELKDVRPDVPWIEITMFRNNLVHEYFGTDREQVWDTATKSLPPLKLAVLELLNAKSDD